MSWLIAMLVISKRSWVGWITKQWTQARRAYLAGNVLAMRADVEALGLVPLALPDQGKWDPEPEYWGEASDPIDDWAKPIIARGKRPTFEMEQLIPGAGPEDFDWTPSSRRAI